LRELITLTIALFVIPMFLFHQNTVELATNASRTSTIIANGSTHALEAKTTKASLF